MGNGLKYSWVILTFLQEFAIQASMDGAFETLLQLYSYKQQSYNKQLLQKKYDDLWGQIPENVMDTYMQLHFSLKNGEMCQQPLENLYQQWPIVFQYDQIGMQLQEDFQQNQHTELWIKYSSDYYREKTNVDRIFKGVFSLIGIGIGLAIGYKLTPIVNKKITHTAFFQNLSSKDQKHYTKKLIPRLCYGIPILLSGVGFYLLSIPTLDYLYKNWFRP